ncbi:MAG: hypothetical protein US60_C0025G0005 [Microgenomates group bacterium GW2011_GWC1_37_8]|uniref:Uncharacterized protein n=1 Tax=Candidatus Woesebacteria bacterium GW2011_GWB1_38_8 TaxID=1618570 RepID=A0A0G0L1P0_9BACT|nr:MAG: hypothetical protein US60_C0025G0005 [Microgenomates group bacterium GW2011_GWC1_37_8]KKQ84917.1 MAG: hypothetical protein UT08_C0012G0013 [Candidatus Woesebacteria bacterium GW2011_GWB1_38_8]
MVINMNHKIKRYLIPTTAMLGLIFIGLLSVSYVSAQDSGNYPSIVAKIAEKFNLNEADVQAVFDEEREAHYADMQARWSERLDDLVNDGKITAEQKQAILDKHEEMQNKMEELRDLEPKARREKMQTMHEEFKAWAEGEGIDLPLIGPVGSGHGHGFKALHMMGAN